jgi:hypothetical protein
MYALLYLGAYILDEELTIDIDNGDEWLVRNLRGVIRCNRSQLEIGLGSLEKKSQMHFKEVIPRKTKFNIFTHTEFRVNSPCWHWNRISQAGAAGITETTPNFHLQLPMTWRECVRFVLKSTRNQDRRHEPITVVIVAVVPSTTRETFWLIPVLLFSVTRWILGFGCDVFRSFGLSNHGEQSRV